MRIAVFFTWDVSLQIWQDKGLLEREIRLYKELINKGANITFYSWGDEKDLEIAEKLEQINLVPIYTKIKAPKSKILRALYSFIVPFKLRKELQDFDLIKTNQMWGSWVAVLSKWLTKKPLLLRSGFELYDFTYKQGHGFLRCALIWLISKTAYISADRIHVATTHDAQVAQRTFGAKQDKIFIFPNWIDTEIFASQNLTKKDNHILFVGRLTEQKNIPMLIEALKDTNITLDIVGEGELKNSLKAIASNLGIQVNFLGSVANDQLPAIYNSYPAYILPSHYEGNPKTLLEAMACGCAVIGTSVDGISNVINDGKTGFLCDKTANDIKQKIIALIGNKQLQKDLGTAARKQIKETQSLSYLVDEEIEAYKNLTGSNQ